MASKLKIKVNGHVHSMTASWDIVTFEFTHFGIPGISQTLDDPTRQRGRSAAGRSSAAAG